MAALSQRLAALAGEIGHGTEASRGAGGPSVDPRLTTTYSPWALEHAARKAADCAPPEAAGAPPEGGPPGLVSGHNPKTLSRYGLRGLTHVGRRTVRRAACLLEEDRRCVAFWTITLPDQAAARVFDLDCWHAFQARIRQELGRRLREAGLPARFVAVAELHPARSARAGRPIPHLHVVFQGKLNRWHRWALDRWQLDGIIAAAVRTATGESCDTAAAGNVQPVKKSVARYLSKYITKGREPGPVCVAQGQGLPLQWWFISQGLRAEVAAATVRLPVPFVRWLHEHGDALAHLGELQRGSVDVVAPGAPAVWWIQWSGAGAVGRCWGRWLASGRAAAALWVSPLPCAA